MENNIEHIIRVAIYTRVSSAEQAEKGTSLESQAEQLEAFCMAQRWESSITMLMAGFPARMVNALA